MSGVRRSTAPETVAEVDAGRRWLVAAGGFALVTGVIALSGHVAAVVAHAFGTAAAVAVPTVLAVSTGSRRAAALVGLLVLSSLLGVAWAAVGGRAALVVGHVLTGVAGAAGLAGLGLRERLTVVSRD
jgi:hypothetical protein